MQEVEEVNPDHVANLDKKAALLILNPAFWFLSNFLQAGVLLLAGSAMANMDPDHLRSIALGCHVVNCALQLISLEKFDMSGNNVANIFQTNNKVANALVSVGSYAVEAVGRNFNSAPNILLKLGVIDNNYTGSTLVASQAIAGVLTSSFVFWLVATERHEPYARGVQYARSAIANYPPVVAVADACRVKRDQIIDEGVVVMSEQSKNMSRFFPR